MFLISTDQYTPNLGAEIEGIVEQDTMVLSLVNRVSTTVF